MKYKFIIFLSVCFLTYAPSFAQVRTDINVHERSNSSDDEVDDNSSNYNNGHIHDYSLGFGGGATKMYGDLPTSRPQQVYIVYFEKNITQSVTTGETIENGYLESNGLIHSLNHFTSVDQHLTIELGTLFHLFYKNYYNNIVTRLVGGIYVGGGIGVINNDLVKISNPNESIFVANTGLDNPVIEKNSTALYFPVNVGYNLHIARKVWILRGLVFNVNLQYSYGQSDYIDGYDPPSRANKANDQFAVLSAGMRFFITNYKKSEQ